MRILSLLSMVPLFFMTACQDGEHKPYFRIHSGSFDVASKSFVPATGNGPKITLLGAVHIGEKSYYREIQRRLDKADLVLFEMMGDPREVKALEEEVRRNCPEHLDMLTPKDSDNLNHGKIAKLAGLTKQTREINYERPHFVHADITLREMYTALNSKKMSICNRLMQAKTPNNQPSAEPIQSNLPSKTDNEVSRGVIALTLVKKILETRQTIENDKKIIFDRNDIAINVLKNEIKHVSSGQEIVIFYGAAHMEDLELSLLKMNYRYESSEWLQAFPL